MTLQEAAALVGGVVQGDGSVSFHRLAPVHDAGEGDLAFLADRRYLKHLADCGAQAVLISESLSDNPGGPEHRMVVADPQAALMALLNHLHPARRPAAPSIHDRAAVHPEAELGRDVVVAAGAVVGAGVRLGDRCQVGENTVLGDGVTVGEDAVLFPNVTVYPGAVLGDRVRIHAGTRIGVDGFGYVLRDGRHEKVPQVGGCVIEDDVEIGANCTIDRGSIGRTVIGQGTKVDNMVHIAHNVRIGAGSVLVAQVGIAGSTDVGPGVAFGGQSGVAGHLTIGAGARIGAKAGVIGDVGPGETVSGFPARNHRDFLRAMAALKSLPELMKRLRTSD